MTKSADAKQIETILEKYPDLETDRENLKLYYKTRNAWEHPLSGMIYATLRSFSSPKQAKDIIRQLSEIDWDIVFNGETLSHDLRTLDVLQSGGGHCDRCQNLESRYIYPATLIHPEREGHQYCYDCLQKEQQYHYVDDDDRYILCAYCTQIGKKGGMIRSHPNIKLDRGWICEACLAIELDKVRITCVTCGAVTLDHVAEDTCNDCYRKVPIKEHINGHLTRARKAKTPATLTLEEWTETVDFFNHRCAYCGKPYQILEHLLPISKGGGTTKDNCLPACYSCNAVKGSLLPHESLQLKPKWGYPNFKEVHITRIKQWLAQFNQPEPASQ